MISISKYSVKNVDIFILTNICFFIVLCFFRYYERFLHYRGSSNIGEFFVYATAIITLMLILWSYFRRFNFETSMLVLLEIGIMMHFAGAFIMIDGYRLYDAQILWIRYDKYVHFVNSFVVSILVRKIFIIQKIEINLFSQIFIFLIVLGLGAIVEIVEYGVTKTVAHNGVGDYDNNMQDLIGNCGGGMFYMWLTYVNLFPSWLYHIIAKDKIVTEKQFQVVLLADE